MDRLDQIEIHTYSSKYQKDIIDLIVGIQQKEYGLAITAPDQPDLSNIPRFYQKDNGNFWVAVLNEKVIGTLALLDIGKRRAALRKMFVQHTYRGPKFKVAPMLLATLFDWARSVGLKEIYLGTTPKFIAAHRFYEKNDFEEIARESLPDAFPIMSVDTRFYKYEI